MPLTLSQELEHMEEYDLRRQAGLSLTAQHRVMGKYLNHPGAELMGLGVSRDIAEDVAWSHKREVEEQGIVVGYATDGQPIVKRFIVVAMWFEELCLRTRKWVSV